MFSNQSALESQEFPREGMSVLTIMNRKNVDFLQKIWKIWKNRIWGLEGGLGGFCLVNFHERVAQKLRIVILLHFGLVTF